MEATKTCTGPCGRELPLAAFWDSAVGRRGRRSRCRDCRAEHARARKCGLSVEQLRALLAIGICAICGTSEPGGKGAWDIDHDHACCPPFRRACGDCVRAVLCSPCNILLGVYQDDPTLLRAKAEYLGWEAPNAERLLAAAEYLEQYAEWRAAA